MVNLEAVRMVGLAQRQPLVGIYLELALKIPVEGDMYYCLRQIDHIVKFYGDHASLPSYAALFRTWQDKTNRKKSQGVLDDKQSRGHPVYVEKSLLLCFLESIQESTTEKYKNKLVFKDISQLPFVRENLQNDHLKGTPS
jgi:hypothetical protein